MTEIAIVKRNQRNSERISGKPLSVKEWEMEGRREISSALRSDIWVKSREPRFPQSSGGATSPAGGIPE